MRPIWIIVSPLLWIVASGSGTSNDGLRRVKIDDFTLRLCPSLSNPNLANINSVRDLAENLVVDELQSYDWGNQTSYQYAGLGGVGIYSQNDDCTTLIIFGGVVTFTADSQTIPTYSQVESVLATALNSEMFKSSLQSKFPYLSSVTYLRVTSPSSAPTQSPVGNHAAISQETTSTTAQGGDGSVNLGVIVGAVVGGLVGAAIVAILLLVRRRRSAAREKELAYVVSVATQPDSQVDPECSSGSSSNNKQTETNSESGSPYAGRLGRMLAAAKGTTAVTPTVQEVDASHGSTREESGDDDDEDNSYSSDYVGIRMLEPQALHPVLSLESFEEEKGRHVLKKDMMISETTFPAWRTTPGSSPDESNVPCALQPTDLSAKALAAEWASKSLLDKGRVRDERSVTTGESDGHDYALDDLWDPDDCETSSSGQRSDPFLPSQDAHNMNRNQFSRSGSDSDRRPGSQSRKSKRSRSYNQPVVTGEI